MINNQEGYQCNGTPSQQTLSPLYLRRTEGIPHKWVVFESSKGGHHWGLYSICSPPPVASRHEWCVTMMATCMRCEDSELRLMKIEGVVTIQLYGIGISCRSP